MNFKNISQRVTASALTFSMILGAASAAAQDQLDADEIPAGSVRPTVTLDEQNAPCFADERDPSLAMALLDIEELRDDEGNIRVQVYPNDEDKFLETGEWLVRIDVALEDDKPQVCVTLPTPGDYALVVMHDKDADGRADIFTEGFGFSRNPELGLGAPDHDEVVMTFSAGLTEMDVVMKYIMGGNNRDRRRRRR